MYNHATSELFERIDSRNKAGFPSPVEDNGQKKKSYTFYALIYEPRASKTSTSEISIHQDKLRINN